MATPAPSSDGRAGTDRAGRAVVLLLLAVAIFVISAKILAYTLFLVRGNPFPLPFLTTQVLLLAGLALGAVWALRTRPERLAWRDRLGLAFAGLIALFFGLGDVVANLARRTPPSPWEPIGHVLLWAAVALAVLWVIRSEPPRARPRAGDPQPEG